MPEWDLDVECCFCPLFAPVPLDRLEDVAPAAAFEVPFDVFEEEPGAVAPVLPLAAPSVLGVDVSPTAALFGLLEKFLAVVTVKLRPLRGMVVDRLTDT